MKDYSHFAIKALTSAIEHLEDFHERPQGTFRTKESSRDIVTEVDLKLEEILVNKLKPSGVSIIGEESYNECEGLPELFWAIDPIDGTVNFVHNLDYWGISIALVRRTKNGFEFPLGFIALPAKRKIFTTTDSGAYVNGKRLRGQLATSLNHSLWGVCLPSSDQNTVEREKQLNAFNLFNHSTRGVLRLGSACATLALTGSYHLQGVLGFHSPIWDVAAGIALVEKSCGKTFAFNVENHRISFLLSQETLHSPAKNLLEKII